MIDICLSVKTGFSFVPTKAFAERGCAAAPAWEEAAVAGAAFPLDGETAEVLMDDVADDEVEEEEGPSMGSGEPGAE